MAPATDHDDELLSLSGIDIDAPGGQEFVRRTLAEIARRRHGVITVHAAGAAGVSRTVLARGARRGWLERCYPGVYRLSGVPPTWHGDVLAACDAWGEHALASHACAARLWDLAGFPRADIELTVPRKRKRALSHQVHRPTPLAGHERAVIRSIPVTSITRTFLDLASTSPVDRVEEALDDALRRGLVTLPRLRWYLSAVAAPGRPGVRSLRMLVQTREQAVPESVLERRLLRTIRAAGLPAPVPQYEVSLNGVRARLDFAYPDSRVALEADGRRWHSSVRAFERDARRHSELAARGWRVVRVTWLQLHERPDEVVAAVRAALRDGDRSGRT